MSLEALEDENKLLRAKLEVLSEELKRRNTECSNLRDELLILREVKREYDSQCDLITELKAELEHARECRASLESKVKAMTHTKQDDEHRAHMALVRAGLSGDEKARTGAVLPLPKWKEHPPPAGSIMGASGGLPVVCKSSDISSLGFAPVERPSDFLNSIGSQFQVTPCVTQRQNCGDEEEVCRLMAMAREEAMMDIKYAEVSDSEERDLIERFEALRRWKPR
uniref:Uncharacterized protein n=1 Tax=Trypanosoma congolense (strain IL3000) TaxID=1068625 RepID=G0UXV0_TRYCI|nr:conserved hypothetical protein [Trypanosoma congolense IL3000]